MAEVVKPNSPMMTIKASTTINNQLFTYAISDRGWFTSGSIYPKWDVTSEKTYTFDYENTQANAATEERLRADAKNKCDELGQIDFSELLKSSGVNYFLETSIDSDGFYFYSEPSTVAGYFCRVQIHSTK